MASSSSSSSSTGKQGISVPSRSLTGVKQDKKWPTVDEYRYLAAASSLLGQQIPKRVKSKLHRTVDSDDSNTERTEQNQIEKRMNGSKTDNDIKIMRNLAKEMGLMLSNAKSKGHTNELLKLFKNTLNNFVVDKQQPSTGLGEKPDTNAQNLSNKRALKPEQTQAKRLPAGTGVRKKEKPAAGSSSTSSSSPVAPSESKQSKQTIRAVDASDHTVLPDKEKPVISTTTPKRSKIREPLMSKMIESSKTNTLHRCYGKQSIKALPLTYKGGKKSNGVGNFHRPPLAKSRNTVKVTKPAQQSTVSQQMKTIYENEQFDKSSVSVSKSLDSKVTKASECVVKPAHCDSKQSDSIAKSSVVMKNALPSETKPTSQNALNKSFDSENKEKLVLMKCKKAVEETENQEVKNNTIPIPPALGDTIGTDGLATHPSEQDNSLVQRLTTFWNRKLNKNKDENNSSSQSSIGSSTTYVINASSRDNFKSSEKCSNESLSDLPIDRDDYDDTTSPVIGRTDQRSKRVNSTTELPDIKVGLMDELIRVLKNGNNKSYTKTTKDVILDDKNKENCDKAKEETVDGGYDVQVSSLEHVALAKNSTCHLSIGSNEYTDDEEYSTEDNVVDDTDDTDINYNNEETVEVIQSCLLRTVTVNNFNKNINDEDGAVTSDDSSEEYLDEGDKNQMTICEITGDEECETNQEVALLDHKEPTNEWINCETSEMNEPKTDANAIGSFDSFTSDNKDKIAAAIMNVNDIIVNLRNLIYTIETIPEELKELSLDINNLPIPDKFMQTISLLLDNGAKQKDSDLITSLLADLASSEIGTTVVQDYSINSFTEKTIGCCSRKVSLFTCYYASTFTIPIFQSVLNPIQVILFPKRYDYLKSKKKTNQVRFISEISEVLPNNMEGDVKNVSEVTRSCEEKYCHDVSQKSGDVNGERYAYVTSTVPATHTPNFTLFYRSMNPSKVISTKVSPSILFEPCKTTTVALNKATEPETNKEIFTAEKNSTLDLVRTTSNDSCNARRDSDHKDDGNGAEVTNVNCNPEPISVSDSICSQDNFASFADIALSNEVNVGRQLTCNGVGVGGSGRRRRPWRQTYMEDENNTMAGGAGDSGVMSTFPCHRTSSMSVIVSSSVNDTNSQPDIHVIESEYRMRSLTSHSNTMSRPQSEADNFGCDVIQEICEEHMSEIEDCVMVEQHQKLVVERKSIVLSDTPLLHKDEAVEDKFSSCNRTMQGDYHTENSCATSTTEWGILKKPPTRDVGTMVSISKASLMQNDNDNDSGTSVGDCSKISKVYKRDYVVLCCETITPRRSHRVLIQKTMNIKYNLDALFDCEPALKEELARVINIDHLCEKEKQLIAICLMLFKHKASLFDNSIHLLLENLGKRVSSLWNMTSNVSGKITGAKKRLIIKYQTKTKLLISCSYRRLIKIVYTTLISLILCFIIQKQFCGISLPVYFPW